MRLSQRLSRLSQTPGKSRAADMRDRLSRPYVNRAGKSLSLGWETLPPLKGAGRVEKAENLRPFYQDAAKGRQKDHGGTAPGKSLVVKLPQVKARGDMTKKAVQQKVAEPKNSEARGGMAKNSVPVKLPEGKNSDARDAAGKAAGVRVLQATGRTTPITAAEALAAAPKLATHGRPTKGNENKGNIVTLKARGNSKEFLAARINRDHPEIAERVKAGEFKSIRAAAIVAGIVKVKTPLERLFAEWKKASQEERAEFLKSIKE